MPVGYTPGLYWPWTTSVPGFSNLVPIVPSLNLEVLYHLAERTLEVP